VPSRRDLLKGAAGAAAGVLATKLVDAIPAAAQAPRPTVPSDPTKVIGGPTTKVGGRSPFFVPERAPYGLTEGTSKTPIHKLTGTITPSDLFFERHHAGIPAIDPARHELLVHGLVERPMVFRLDDLKRFPTVSRVHFIECSGNGRNAYRSPKPTMTPQDIDGQVGNAEWTGVLLRDLLAEVGLDPKATWMLAEGGDACLLARSIPVEKALDDILLAWGQNGEPLRPEAGFPLKLIVPGWEGNINVKWLRRLELGTAPWMTRWETSKYTDPLPGDVARQFSFEVDAKSIITSPAHPERLAKGPLQVTGLAWSGRGRVTRVEVSTDGGATWADARIDGTPQPKAVVRFWHPWTFTGRETLLMSRATDETGYVQPDRKTLLAVRGIGTDFHFNEIRAWKVARDGTVTFANGELA
jgi:sulfane dehydrogenase subunit SoxC